MARLSLGPSRPHAAQSEPKPTASRRHTGARAPATRAPARRGAAGCGGGGGEGAAKAQKAKRIASK
eukprot:scaffold18151_cov48-Phaeocystis_antarctica.AAC.1